MEYFMANLILLKQPRLLALDFCRGCCRFIVNMSLALIKYHLTEVVSFEWKICMIINLMYTKIGKIAKCGSLMLHVICGRK